MGTGETLYLIDGSSYIYRAYYAIRHLSSPKGVPTNALYGFTQMLLKVIKERKPDHLAVVFDSGRVTFRTALYESYKANRVAMPSDLVPQLAPIKEMVRAFNIPALELSGFEADDIIATLAVECEQRGLQVVVVTGDKDLMQIVTDKVTLLDTMKDKTSGRQEVLERFGVAPEQVVDVLGLAGDTSDNIPGVPGVGEKTAIKLIQEFGTLDLVLERAGTVKGKLGERLREFADQARLSRTLATVDCRVPIDWRYEDLAFGNPDNRKLGDLFKEYGFTTLMKDLACDAPLPADDYRLILHHDELETLVTKLQQAGRFALSLEATGLDPFKAEIVGFSFSANDHEAYYVPIGHLYPGAPDQLQRDQVFSLLAPLLTDPALRKIGHNLKYDRQLLAGAGVGLEGAWFDTMLASYLLNPARSSHKPDSLAAELLDHRMMPFEELAGAGKQQVNVAQTPVAKATIHACEGADVAQLLHRLFLPRLQETGMEHLFFEVEMPLMEILADMEQVGVMLDEDLLASLSRSFGEQLGRLEEQIYALANGSFNINSPKQLGEVLFGRLGLPAGRKTKGKTGLSTDVEELERLALDHDIARKILQYRSVVKLKTTYADALPKLIDRRTGRVHTSYNQAVTATGRLSSSDPNLQNIPIRTDEGRTIRRAFIAPPGHLLLSADYSQIELRILAHLSQDAVFCDAFARDEDIHTRTASEVFGVFPEMVTAEMRRQAKTINFGVTYGQGAFSLAKELGVAPRIAKEFIDNYFARHSGARGFLDACIHGAELKGFVTTLLGRRLPIPDIKSTNGNIRAFAQRNAVNYPIQGSAADVIKMAMVKISARMKAEGLRSRLIMQVHDELVFEVPEAEKLAMERLVRHEMEKAVSLRVPLKVDLNFGTNWSEAH